MGEFTLDFDGLPAGLSAVHNGDGSITVSGTPTVSGPVIFDVTATDAGGNMSTARVVVLIEEPATPTPVDQPPVPRTAEDVLPSGQAQVPQVPYSERVAFFNDDGGIANLTVVILSGLPSGLTATSPGSGVIDIQGTPNASGTFIITVQASDGTNTPDFEATRN